MEGGMRRLSRRDVLRFTGLTLAGTVVAGCQPVPSQVVKETVVVEKEVVVTPTPAPEQAVIEWWTINLKAKFGEIMQSYIDGYQAQHSNVTIEWVDVPGAEVARKFITSLAAGDPPDLANMYEISRFIELQAVLPLGEYVPNEDQEAFDGYWEGGKIMGKHYTLPWYGSFATPTLISRKLFQEGGLDPDKPPLTWQEMFDLGRQAKAQWGEDVYPWCSCWNLQIWAIHEGLELLTEDGQKAAVNTPEWEAHIETILGLNKEGLLIPDGYECPDSRIAIDWFWQGRGAVSTTGPWILNRTTTDVLEQLDIDVTPTMTGSKNRIPLGWQVFVVARQSKFPAVAVDYGLYVVKPPNIVEFCKAVTIAPCYLPALEDPFFKEEPKEPAKDKQEELIRKGRRMGIEDMQRVEVVSSDRPFFYWTAVSMDVWKQVSPQAAQVVNGEMSIKEFLALWEEKINATIEEALKKGAF
ncbi:MAG: ABC transporter substrate-binding protein [Anaerolineae bacterium]